MKTLVVIQARTGSTRLPNKVMMQLAGKPLLQRMVERVRAGGDYDLVIATTNEPADAVIRNLCREMNVDCFSGHPTDLLDRHYQAARLHNADAVVKIPSDCPLIDPAVIKQVLGFFFQDPHRFDFVSNLHPPTYPDGNDVEVMTSAALEIAWREASKPFEREHTTPFIWERPERFRIGNVTWQNGLDYSMSHRWTIDYPEDYAFLNAVYNELWSEARPIFALQEILDLLTRRPDIFAVNAKYAGINWYRNHLDELTTVTAKETKTPSDITP